MILFGIAGLIQPDNGSKAWTAQSYIDYRERFERHINPTYNAPRGKNESILYGRYRPGLDLDSGAKWTAKLEYEYSSEVTWTHAANASTQASDLYQGYAKYQSDGWTDVAGRQRIDVDDERLFGPSDWQNVSRSWDAGRVDYGQWFAWAGRLGLAGTEPESARVGSIHHADKDWGSTSLIYKHDLASVLTIDIYTLNHDFNWKHGKTAFEGNGAVQVGRNNGLDQRAWAWHVKGSEEILPRTTLAVEGNAASGGSNQTTSFTFDNLYPSNHDKYGLADLQGWRNMYDFAVKLEHRATPEVTLRSEFHHFTLESASDYWYGETGAINDYKSGSPFIDPGGTDGVDLGKEYDFGVDYATKHSGKFGIALCYFEPGRYVELVSKHSDQLTFGYLYYQSKF